MTIRAPDGRKAVIGNSHFCVTYRASVFNQLPKTSSDYLLGGNSEDRFLDRPVVKCDLYRLATTKSYVRHMGNKIEAWMSDYGESGIIIKKYLDTNLLEREASCKPLTYIIKLLSIMKKQLNKRHFFFFMIFNYFFYLAKTAF